MSLNSLPRLSAARDFESRGEGSGHSWAHVSGWAQLSGSRQTVSCVLACANQARALAELLPFLSDTLTECGYPWEVIVADCSSTDETRAMFRDWAELPGFRLVAVDRATGIANAFAAGLMKARGDAVILLDPHSPHASALIPRMILLWEGDARLVHLRSDAHPGSADALITWDDAEMARRIRRSDFMLPPECTRLGLVDRRLVDWLLRSP